MATYSSSAHLGQWFIGYLMKCKISHSGHKVKAEFSSEQQVLISKHE